MFQIHQKKLAGAWALVVVALGIALAVQFSAGLKIKTSILDLLPASQKDPVVETAYKEYADLLGRKMVFMVGAPNQTEAIAAADFFAEQLGSHTDAFETILCKIDKDFGKAYYDFFFKNRFQIVSGPNQILLNEAGNSTGLVQKARELLYSPMVGQATAQIEADPLFLFFDWIKNMPRDSGNFSLVNNHLVLVDNKTTYVLVTAISKNDVFGQTAQFSIMGAIASAQSALKTQHLTTNLLWTGMIKYGHHAAQTAQREVSTIGTGSTIGIILLMIFAFGSLKQLAVGVLPIIIGVLVAFTTCTLVFDDLHIITLVFGASLIGVCIDYSFHYLAAQFTADAGSDGQQQGNSILKQVFKGITLGMITSSIGYLSILIAPFSGLRQMALFSSVGLMAAYATVVCWFPLFRLNQIKKRKPLLWVLADKYLFWFGAITSRRYVQVGLGIVVIICGIGAFKLSTNDDVRLLRNQNKTLFGEEQKIAELTNSFDKSRFILVEGASPSGVLQNEERISIQLAKLVEKNSIKSYRAISSLLPSIQSQKKTARQMAQVLAGDTFLTYLQELGFDSQQQQSLLAELNKQPPATMTELTSSPVFKPISHLWLGKTPRGFASVIMIDTINNEADLIALTAQLPFATYIDKVSQISNMFSRYRFIASILAAAGYLVIFALMLWRYGIKKGILVILPPVITAVSILGIMGHCQITANLFTFLALLLILGISIDYTIFFAEAKGNNIKTAFAIFLSAITTILSFGLLALSTTPVLSTFGLTVLIGIAIATLLSPISRSQNV